jgi:PTS system ascorbate-specific IIA component
MNNILIIAHQPLASALRSAALHVFPDAAHHIAVMDVPPTQSPEQTLALAQKLLVQLHTQDPHAGTLVMSDVLGATPCNVAQKLVGTGNIKCVAGASLPMLLRAITYCNESLIVLADKALAGAAQGAIEVS